MKLEILGETVNCLGLGSAGPVVILVHGFGSDAASWLMNQPALSREASVHAIDLPGHGAAAHRQDDFGVARLSTLIAAMIPMLSDRPVHLVGHSLGAAIALRVASQHEGLVRALTLIAPAGLGDEYNSDFVSKFVAASDLETARSALELLVSRKSLINQQMILGMLAAGARPHTRAAWHATAPVVGDAWRDREASRALLDRLNVPVQIIWGGQDMIFGSGFRLFNQRGVTHVLADAGHLPHMEASRDVNRLIAEFGRMHTGEQ